MSLPDLNLTAAEWRALQRQRETGDASTVTLNSALDAVLAHRPAPALPTGWVLLRYGDGNRAFWHADGRLYTYDDGSGGWISAEAYRDRPTPLRVLADDEVAVKLGDFFVAEDGEGALTIWREREGRDPVAVLYRYTTPALFDALVATLPHRDDR